MKVHGWGELKTGTGTKGVKGNSLPFVLTVQDGARWCKKVQDSARWCKMVQDGARWCKMVQDGVR